MQAAKLAEVETERLLRGCNVLETCQQVRAAAVGELALANDEGAVAMRTDTQQAAEDAQSAEDEPAEVSAQRAASSGDNVSPPDAPSVLAALQSLLELVSMADAVPEYAGIVMPRVRSDVGRRVARSLLQAYTDVHAALSAADGFDGFEASSAKPPAQVAALLGVTDE